MSFEQELLAHVGDMFDDSDQGDVIKWLENNLYLPDRVTSRPGLISFEAYPYAREVIRAMDNPENDTVTLCFATQTSKTTCLVAYLLSRLLRDPTPSLFVMPNADLAQSFSETRLQPLIDHCERLAELKPHDRHRYKNMQMEMETMTINLVGSNSPANISSRPVGLAVLDEVDKFATATSREASAFELALERTKSFPNRKHIISSTPTVDTGTIWEQFLLGDQRYFYWRCPECGHEQTFLFDQLKWDADAQGKSGKWDLRRIEDTTRYECPECGHSIVDGNKSTLLRDAQWIATSEQSRRGHASFHLNSLYSASLKFSDVAIYFLQKKGYLDGLQNFVNSWLAQPWQDQFNDIDEDELPTKGYRKNESWDDEAIKLMAVDVQSGHFWYAIRSYDVSGNSRLYDEGKLTTWEDIEEARKRAGVEAQYVFIDAAYQQQEVFAHSYIAGYTPMRGEDRKEMYYHRGAGKRVYSQPQKMVAYSVGNNAQISMLMFSSQHAQDLLAWYMTGQANDWTVPEDVSDDYKIQIKSHVKKNIVSKKTGVAEYKWCKRKASADDHLWDCETILIVAAAYGKLIQASA